MENDNNEEHISAASNNIILGTSSQAIVEGLHNGSFTEAGDTPFISAIDDKDQIVNQQDQNEVVNAAHPDPTPAEVTDLPASTSALDEAEEDFFGEEDLEDTGLSETPDTGSEINIPYKKPGSVQE